MSEYWTQVFDALDQMVPIALERTPLIALLGYTKLIPRCCRKYLGIALLLAKRRVACSWGRGRAPKFKEWLDDLIYCQEQLTLYTETLPRASKPRNIWSPLQSYLLARLTESPSDVPEELAQ